jgi:hypothetical protein
MAGHDLPHGYEIAHTAGVFLRVEVEQRGIDVVVAVYGHDGSRITEVDQAGLRRDLPLGRGEGVPCGVTTH